MAKALRVAVALGTNTGLDKPFSPGDQIRAVDSLFEARPALAPVETVGAITADF
jgi:hypothetical protein